MREILFKAKSIVNGEWTEGSLLTLVNEEGVVRAIICPIEWNFGRVAYPTHDLEIGFWKEVDPETICQYTGMKDKDGNKVWENDIFDIHEENHTITMRRDSSFISESNWVNKYRHKVEFTPGSLMNTQRYLAGGNISCKIIGNYIDNPELLERSQHDRKRN